MKKSIRLVAIVLAMIMLVSMVTGCGPKPTDNGAEGSDTAKTIKIACFYNLSGNGADTGNQSLQGAQLAADQINASGGIKSLGGAKIELVPADTLSDTAQAKAVADRVLSDESIMAGIGVSGSAYGIPMLPAFEKVGVPFIINGIADNFTTQGYTTVFQHCPTSSDFGTTQIRYLKYLRDDHDLDITKVGALYENTEAGISNAATLKAQAEEAGMEWVFEETYTLGTLTDASNMVVSMKNSGVQVVFITARDADIKIIVNAMQSLKYFPMLFGSGAGFLFPSFAEELGESVNGILSVATTSWDSTYVNGLDGWSTAAAEYEAKHGYFMAEHANGGYTAVKMVADALEKTASRDTKALCDALRALDEPTMSGVLKFDETGKNLNARSFVVQWQKCEDGVYRPCSVYPDDAAGSKIQLESLQTNG